MRNMYKTIIVIASLFLANCIEDDSANPNNCDVNFTEFTVVEVEDVNEKAMAFAENASFATCEALRASYLAYKEALEEANICLNVQQDAAYQQALNDAEAAIQELDCGQFGS